MKTVKLLVTVLLSALMVTMTGAASVASETNVIDGADLFTAGQEALLTEQIAKNYEAYGLVFAVETVNSLEGEDLESFATDRANQLGVGEKDKNNGVYIIISRDDRMVRFALGSAVDNIVSDSQVQTIINQNVLPAFRSNDFYQGVFEGMEKLGEGYLSSQSPKSTMDSNWNAIDSFIFILLVVGLIIVGIVILSQRLIQKSEKDKYWRDRMNKSIEVARLVSQNHRKQFDALPDDEARKQFITPFYEKYFKKDRYFRNDYYEEFMKRYLAIPFYKAANGSNYLWGVSFRGGVGDNSIMATVEKVKAELKQKAEVRAQKEKQKKEKAKQVWDSLSKDQKKRIRKARTNSEKRELMKQYNPDGYSIFPTLMTLYAVQMAVIQDSGSSSSNTSRSSKSSSSSYDSSSSSSSSYGGGSFDGGGASGSW